MKIILLIISMILITGSIEAKPTSKNKSKYKSNKSICKKKNIKPSSVWYGGSNKSKVFR